MFICVLVTIMFVTSHLSVPKFTDRVSRTDFSNGYRQYSVTLKYIYTLCYVLINSMGLENLEDSQPVKFLAFHGIQAFIIAFMSAPPSIPLTVRWIKPKPVVLLRYIFILPKNLCSCLPTDVFYVIFQSIFYMQFVSVPR